MIVISGLSKRYGKLQAVAGIDLRVEPGEVFGFLGPNGAGKTTTMKMLVGLVRPSAGRVLVGGHDVHRQPVAAKALIGYIPDRPFIYEKLSGREFLFFLAGLYGLRGAEIGREATRLLELFELSAWSEELVETYSHGMRQRLVMAGALLHRPRLLVVDEPMVGLDPRGAELVKQIFRSFAAEGGTVFLSTHTLEVAEQVCDRVAILNRGRISAAGTLEQLRRQAGRSGQERLQEIFLQLTAEAQAAGSPEAGA